MDLVFKIILTLHIIGGSFGLIAGTINLIRQKGNNNHKIVGQVFTYSMLTAGISSLALAALHPNYFLFIVGVFTVYLVVTGKRCLSWKIPNKRVQILDWAITISMLIVSVFFVGLGARDVIAGKNFGIVLIVFGVLGFRFVRTDFNNYSTKAKTKNYWLLVHLQRMIGAYIAAITAFLVVNAKYSPVALPSMVFWLLPTIILTPLIISWSRKYSEARA